MVFKEVALAEICEMNSGGTPRRAFNNYYGGGIKWAKISDIENAEGGYLSQTEETITEEGLKSINNRIFPERTLLLAMYGSVGKTAITAERMATNQAILGIRPKNGTVDLHYLKYWLAYIKPTLTHKAVGGTLQNISLKIVSELKIPLPPLPTQKKIAAILDKADSLRQKDKQLLEQYNKLAQSIFYDMFGNLNEKEKEWDTKSLQEVCSSIVDCPHSTPNHSDGQTDYACIRTSELIGGQINWSSMKYVSLQEYTHRIKRLRPLPGDIVYGREGTFGEAIIIPENSKSFCLGQRTMLMRARPEIIGSVSLWAILRSRYVYNQALQKTNGSTVGHVNVKDIRNFNIVVPPMKTQLKFEGATLKVQKQISKQQSALSHSNRLFQSLLQKAFRGELAKET